MATENDHPRDEELAAYLDRGLSATDRDAIARHLVQCDDCRALIGAPRLAGADDHRATPARLRRLWPIAAAVAAAGVFMVSDSFRSRGATGSTDQLRGDTLQAIEAPVLAVLSPADGAQVRVDTLVLRWAPAGPDVTYDVTIVDADGDAVWSTRTTSHEAAIPPETQRRMRPNEMYYWRADALLRDLRTASTGPRGFMPTAK